MEEPQPGAGYSSTNNNDNDNNSSNISSQDHGEGKMAAGIVGESGGGDIIGRSNGQPDASVGANPGYAGGGGGERSGAQSQPTQQAEGDEKDKPSLNRYLCVWCLCPCVSSLRGIPTCWLPWLRHK